MVERRIEEKTLVFEFEMFLGLADTALAKGEELFAFGERSYGHGPFFDSNRHLSEGEGERR